MQAAAPAPGTAAPAQSCPSVQLEQGNVPWGLDRINQRALPLDNVYSWTTTGQGINVYVISTVGALVAVRTPQAATSSALNWPLWGYLAQQ